MVKLVAPIDRATYCVVPSLEEAKMLQHLLEKHGVHLVIEEEN